ncbi:MAG: DUF2298 domain-containing protein [Chloroflexota bacterium]|nr:DUF2298 domain-containing protein [Chloroflexota bacterium]
MSGSQPSEVALLARWLLALELIGWGFYPLLYLVTPGLRDRGLTVAKPFALLAFTYPAWFVAALGPPLFTTPALVATLLIGAALAWGGAAVGMRRAARPTPAPPRPPILGGATDGRSVLSPQSWGARGAGGGGLIPFLRASWRYVLAAEALFIAAFLGYAWLRGYSPQIGGPGEKPMEIGFLSAATRGTVMPPPDPWLSGHRINYYYLGYAIVAAVAKLTAIPASIAFNLGLATLFAATLTGGVGLVANLLARRGPCVAPRARALALGLPGGYLLALAGNMYAARDILERGREALDTWWWGGLGWHSSRVVFDTGWPAERYGLPPGPAETINEFPFFSFLLGDLHAHVLALPFTLLALAFALDVWIAPPVLAKGEGRGARGEERNARPFTARLPDCPTARLALAAFAIGALYALNSWDLPTYAALYLAALLLPGGPGTLRARRRAAPRNLLAGALFAVLSIALFAPFYAGFTSLVGGQPVDLPEPWRSAPGLARVAATLGLVTWDKTPPGQFFTVYLLPWVAGLIFLTWRWRRGRLARPGPRAGAPAGWIAAALTLPTLALGAALLRMPVFFFAGLLILLAGAVLRPGDREDKADRFAALLFGAAFALVLVTEVAFIRDVFGHRGNTVFKAYYQAWTLLAIAAGYALVRVVDVRGLRTGSRRVPAGALWRLPAAGALALLTLASAAYPLAASRVRMQEQEFPGRVGLDGLAAVRVKYPEEWAGIAWVYDHVPAGAVVAEAPGCSYGDFANLPHNRVSAFAGVSAPAGWAAHEEQWRGGSPELLAELRPRIADLNTLYTTTDTGEAARLLERYGIEWVYVGIFERDGYTVDGVGTACHEGGGYPAAGLAKFDGMLERVFTSEGGRVTIYRRP